jgi:aldehyde dehydrogenase (NAD+)
MSQRKGETAMAAERNGKEIAVVDPATEEVVGRVERCGAEQVQCAVEAAFAAYRSGWRQMKAAERSAVLHAVGQAIRKHAGELAHIESLQTGKPISAARGETLRAARYFEYYAGAVDKFLGGTGPEDHEFFDFTMVEPLGVTAHIVPWNFPLVIFSRTVAAALAMGNAAVVKPAEEAPLSILRVAEIARQAGLPPGVMAVVTGYGEEAGAPLVQHPLVRAVAFTGSVETGKAVLRMAAERVIPVFPELGGKSPNVVFADADLDWAVQNAYAAMFSNAGQTCIAGSRLIVERSIRSRFVEMLVAKVSAIRLGRGLDDPDMGPMISAEHRARVLHYIESGVREGARLVTGGGPPADMPKGYFVRPTIFDQVRPEMRIAREEIFGPVLCVLPFDSEEEAARLANDTEYGLAAGIFTRDIGRALRLSRDIDAGRIYINQYPCGDVTAPFGGNKLSGYGRACGLEALRHFTQLKSVSIRYGT